MPPAGAAVGGRSLHPGQGSCAAAPAPNLESMRRGVKLLLLHTTLPDERPSARARLRAALGPALATLLVGALTQRRAGERRSSPPYNRM
jgi:hypothetical protein